MSEATTTGGYSNPVRLSVKTRKEDTGAGDVADAGPSNYGEKERLLRGKKRNEEIRRKGDQWADKLMEETVDQGTFKRALRYIHPSQYGVIIHERHLNSHCSYPLCQNPPSEPFNSNRRFKISTTNRSITEVEGNKEEGFCSKVCGIRSKWVKGQLESAGSVLERGKEWEIELTEDLGLDIEGRMKEVASGSKSGVVDRSRRETPGTKPSSAKGVDLANSGSSSPSKPVPVKQRPPRTSNPQLPVPEDESVPTDLLSGLRIHERPTPKTALPPSTLPPSQSVSSVPRPSPSQTKLAAQSTPTASSPSPIPIRRAPPTSLLGEQSKLAQTVLKASKALNPEPQVNPDSDVEEEHAEVVWEKEVGLDWGGSGNGADEADDGDLWAMMREAREMEGE